MLGSTVRPLSVAATLCAGQFLMMLDTSVTNVPTATVAKDLDTTITGIHTAITPYRSW